MTDTIDELPLSSPFPSDGMPSTTGEGARVVTARGTEDGLVLRIDGRAAWESIVAEIKAFLGTRRRFLEGGTISVEWLDRLPTKDQSSELETILKGDYGIEVMARRKRPPYTTFTHDGKSAKERRTGPVSLFGSADSQAEDPRDASPAKEDTPVPSERKGALIGGISLEEAIEVTNDSSKSFAKKMAKILGEDLPYEEDANARVVFGTFRSGQRVETPFTLIVVGDVNPGADLVAGGDIIVFGSLRGTAHAAAYDDEAQDRVIVALQMQPMQLRIGSVISRGNDDVGKGAEIARIENRRIVVETFNSRSSAVRKVKP